MKRQQKSFLPGDYTNANSIKREEKLTGNLVILFTCFLLIIGLVIYIINHADEIDKIGEPKKEQTVESFYVDSIFMDRSNDELLFLVSNNQLYISTILNEQILLTKRVMELEFKIDSIISLNN